MNKIKVILTISTILWMIVIFLFSHSPADESQDTSNSFINKTIINIIKIFNKDIDEESTIKKFSTPVRKLAHFTEFMILGILMISTFKAYGINNPYIPLVICIIYAVSDELHQYFIPGRACKAFDVLIDSLGSSFGTTIVIFLSHNFK